MCAISSSCAAQHQAAAQRLQERLGEDLVQRAPERVSRARAVERLHRAVPARDAAVAGPGPGCPESMLSRMFSLYSVSSLQLVRLLAQAAVEPPVHERGGGLAGQRLQQVDLLAVERVQAVLAADAQDRDQLALGPAGEVVAEVQRARLGQRLGRGLGVDRLARRPAARTSAPVRGQADACSAPGSKPSGPEDAEASRRSSGRNTASGLDAQRRAHALQQPLGHAAPGRGPRSGPARAAAAPCASCSARGRTAGRCPPARGSSPA